MCESACEVPSDELVSIAIQSTSNGPRPIEGHTISRIPEICFGAVCLELLPWAGYEHGGFPRLFLKSRESFNPRCAKIFEDM